MSRHLIAPLVLVVALLAGLVGIAAWNRGREVQRLTLSERELSIPPSWSPSGDDEDGVLRLRLQWQHADGPLQERVWLTEETLGDIGFDMSTPAGSPAAERTYRRQPPRRAWVAFELAGPAWEAVARRRALRAGGSIEQVGGSRLVAVDAGVDRAGLMQRHDDGRTLVLPAIIALGWVPAESGGPFPYGYVRDLPVDEITVPTGLRAVLEAGAPRSPGEPPPASAAPRFEMDLSVGRFGWPWLSAIRIK